MSMMNDYEEDLDDFPTESREKPAESLVGAYSRRVDRSKFSRKRDHDKDFTTLMVQRLG